MLVRWWRLATILLVALSMGTALAHLLEMPAKLRVDGAFWLRLLQTVYPPGFGTAGAAFEVGAVIGTLALAVLVRRRGAAFGWSLAGAAGVLAAHLVFWIWVAPVNATLVPLSADALPADWPGLRAQWEYGHAARAVLQLLALAALVQSVLVETPATAAAPPAARTGHR